MAASDRIACLSFSQVAVLKSSHVREALMRGTQLSDWAQQFLSILYTRVGAN